MPFHWYLKNRSRFYSLRLHNVFSVYHYASSLMFLNFSAFQYAFISEQSSHTLPLMWYSSVSLLHHRNSAHHYLSTCHPLPISSPLFPRTKDERGASCPLFIIFPTVQSLLSSIWRCHHLLFWHIRFPSYSWSERCSKNSSWDLL